MLAPKNQARAPRARVWRPFPGDVAEVVGLDDGGDDVPPRMHPWFGISLVRSRGVATIEARREVVLGRSSIILIPRFQLFALRHEGAGLLTLLLGDSQLEGLDLSVQTALVTDAALGAELAAIIANWQWPVRADEHASTIRPFLDRLGEHATPLAAIRTQRISSLVPVRDYLRAQVNQPVSTEELSRISGLSEPHLIRAFHFEFGLPPHAYHLRVRLAAACQLLTRGLAVASVAYESGFADQSHLNRRFKAVYGLTPAAWAAASTGGDGYHGRPERS